VPHEEVFALGESLAVDSVVPVEAPAAGEAEAGVALPDEEDPAEEEESAEAGVLDFASVEAPADSAWRAFLRDSDG
jgi:hypothetical protein